MLGIDKVVQPLLDYFKARGNVGLIAVIFLLLSALFFSYSQGYFKEYSEQERANAELQLQQQEVTCQSLLREMRVERLEMKAERDSFRMQLDRVQRQLAVIQTELRMQRQADDQSQVARWKLDRNLRLTWWNHAFERQVLYTQDVNPLEAYNKTWAEILHPDVAEHASKTDVELQRSPHPTATSYDNGFTIEQRADGKYRVYWYVIKESLFDAGRFHGLRGSAVPYKSQKVTGDPQ